MNPVLDWDDFVLWQGDCRKVFEHMPAHYIQTIVTSPPYFGLRDYGTGRWEPSKQQPGFMAVATNAIFEACDHAAAKKKTRYDYSLESSPIQDGRRAGTDAQIAMFHEVCPDCGATRVDDQIGMEPHPEDFIRALGDVFEASMHVLRDDATLFINLGDKYIDGELQLIPARFAQEMRFRGFKLINDIIWCKPNVMPESVTRRFTKAHEHILVFAWNDNYLWRQQFESVNIDRHVRWVQKGENSIQHRSGDRWPNAEGRNMRDWWAIPPANYSDAHFAVFPDEIPMRCILAGTTALDWVLDPFMGSGTTARVARALNRRSVGIELSKEYCQQIIANNAQQTLWTGDVA